MRLKPFKQTTTTLFDEISAAIWRERQFAEFLRLYPSPDLLTVADVILQTEHQMLDQCIGAIENVAATLLTIQLKRRFSEQSSSFIDSIIECHLDMWDLIELAHRSV